jgi:hypothetical protein
MTEEALKESIKDMIEKIKNNKDGALQRGLDKMYLLGIVHTVLHLNLSIDISEARKVLELV